jgi:ADP-heptose:LPS heptosyltransferase
VAAHYRRASLAVGVDSGPLHLAAAVGTSTVRVYGPSDPRVYGPCGPGEHRVLQGELACIPCGNLDHPPCLALRDPPCLAAVSVDQVLTAARQMLGIRDAPEIADSAAIRPIVARAKARATTRSRVMPRGE